MDKPTVAESPQRTKPTPVIDAAALEAHRQVPSVQARLKRVAAIRKANQANRSQTKSS